MLDTLEAFFPRRSLDVSRWRRWLSNLPLGALNILIFTIAVPLGAFAAAVVAEEHGWGALRFASLPDWLAIPLGVLILDLFGYVSHRVLHAVPVLWRLHHVHHSDIEIDFTTTVRHHPAEVLLTVLAVCGATIAFGVSPESVVLYQIAATVLDFASHGNMRVPQRLDRWIRSVFVTPDMHMVHHSAVRRETDSNYGTVFSLWDRMFGSHVATPAGGVTGMTIGLEYRREAQDQRLDRILISPFGQQPRLDAASKPAAAVVAD
jgi:sterol desaturase/sphingolipid hydroxylase (fatty acid hydroxylase superfamily)